MIRTRESTIILITIAAFLGTNALLQDLPYGIEFDFYKARLPISLTAAALLAKYLITKTKP